MRGNRVFNPNPNKQSVDKDTFVFILLVACHVCLLLGIVLLFVPKERVERITQYNKYVNDWNVEGIEEFKGSALSVTVNEYPLVLNETTKRDGSFYPQRDSCAKSGDPGCVSSLAFFYAGDIITNGNDLTVTIRSGESVIQTETIPLEAVYVISKSELSFFSTDYKRTCSEIGGIMNKDNTCSVHAFLNQICYRLKNDKGWKLDTPSLSSLSGSPRGDGCDYRMKENSHAIKNKLYWDHVYYSPNQTQHVQLQVRSTRDTYIQASSLTLGCSSNTNTDSSCFGSINGVSSVALIVLILIGIIGVICDIVLFVQARTKYRGSRNVPFLISLCNSSRGTNIEGSNRVSVELPVVASLPNPSVAAHSTTESENSEVIQDPTELYKRNLATSWMSNSQVFSPVPTSKENRRFMNYQDAKRFAGNSARAANVSTMTLSQDMEYSGYEDGI